MQPNQRRPPRWKHSGFAPSMNRQLEAVATPLLVTSSNEASRGSKLELCVTRPCRVGPRRTRHCLSCGSLPALDSIRHGATRPSPDAKYRPSLSTQGTSLRQGSDAHEISERVAVGTAPTSGRSASLNLPRWQLLASQTPRRTCARGHKSRVNDNRIGGRRTCRGPSSPAAPSFSISPPCVRGAGAAKDFNL